MYRRDGRLVKSIDAFAKMVPLIMPTRTGAQVFAQHDIDYSRIKTFITSQKQEGSPVSLMSLVICAGIRTIALNPEVNRFVANKRIYARKSISTSFIVLKNKHGDGEVRERPETVVRIEFDGTETIDEVSRKVKAVIDKNRKVEYESFADRFLERFFRVPFLTSFAMNLIRVGDRFGIIPKTLLDMSPFHSSIFLTNMASIRMGTVDHHLYDFGTTSIFLALGKSQIDQSIYEMVATIDERICTGHTYSRALGTFLNFLYTPELLLDKGESPREDRP